MEMGNVIFQPHSCRNGRHVLFIDSMAVKSNLTDGCRDAMACLTGLVKKANKILCDRWLMHADSVNAALQQCGSAFQFPTTSVHSDHIRFFYKDPSLRANMNEFLMPDYICYDQQLCDCLIPDLVHENQTCLNAINLKRTLQLKITSWDTLMLYVRMNFRSCLVSHIHISMKIEYNDYSSLYNCQNSSKFISKHRLLDGIKIVFTKMMRIIRAVVS